MQNVADPRAWTFTPANVVDRSGTYYLTLPMGVDSTGVQPGDVEARGRAPPTPSRAPRPRPGWPVELMW